VTVVRNKKRLPRLLLLLFIVTASITFLAEQRGTAVASSAVFPYVQGTQLIDSSGKSFTLRGAQIECPFAYWKPWKDTTTLKKTLSSMLNPAVFNTMSKKWHMNALRIPLSNWVYSANQQLFLQLLDTAIQQATQAGMYVILDLHDYRQGGSPYGRGADMPKPESVSFWKAIAGHYRYNTMIIFDVYNEPHYPSAGQWLNGGGSQQGSTGKKAPIIGMQGLVDAVRSVGARQIISIGDIHDAGTLRIKDPNIIYTTHSYQEVASGSPAVWDADWAGFKGRYPLFYGEWALLPNSPVVYRCQGATMRNANRKVTAFLDYMGQNNISWTAWQFNPPYLIMNHTNFAPTSLNSPRHPWKCNTPEAVAGMGTMVLQYLSGHSS
jgi:hypothetical protein